VSLTPKLEDFVKSKVKTGGYNNASEVVREAVRLLQERDEDRKLEAALKRAICDGEKSGMPIPWDPETVKEQARKSVKGAVRPSNHVVASPRNLPSANARLGQRLSWVKS